MAPGPWHEQDCVATAEHIQSRAGGGASVALISRADYGGARLLVSDIRVAFLLLDEARCAIVARLFGVAKDESVLVSIVAVGALAAW